jgi:hypothetical protein
MGIMSDDPLDVDLDRSATEEPRDISVRRNRTLALVGVVAALAIALVLAYVYLRRPAPAPAATAATQPKATASRAEPGEQIVLPPLDETDEIVRQLVGKLSSNPTVAAWLTTNGLILNFALVTQRIASGEIVTKELGAIGPMPKFPVRSSSGGRLFVDPASYRRYDRYALAVSSLDARGTARLYATIEPRAQDAYRRMGHPTGDFDAVLESAIVAMLKVPIVEGEVELVPKGIVYGYLDPRLENLSASQKHLLRMGPKNVQAIQAKLREMAPHLGISEAKLPR